jgi:hypothetical protein
MQMACALETWADARERAIAGLLAESENLERPTSSLDAAHRRAVASYLSSRMCEERARARRIRAAVAARPFSRIMRQ